MNQKVKIHIEIEKDYQRIDWDEYMNILFATKSGDCPDIFTRKYQTSGEKWITWIYLISIRVNL